MKELAEFEKNIGIEFKDKVLLRQAFTHRSFLNENKKLGEGHNERLEFLGDAVLELVITDYLYGMFGDKTEGEMTSIRSALVNADTCALVARELGVNEFLLLSKGEAKDTGRARQYILANALEAIIGAIYLDLGIEVARDFIQKYIIPLTPKIVSEGLWIDAKSKFQEKSQEMEGITPSYKTIKEIGPDHNKIFTVAVFLGEEKVAEGEGDSKQSAEQGAAFSGLKVKNW